MNEYDPEKIRSERRKSEVITKHRYSDCRQVSEKPLLQIVHRLSRGAFTSCHRLFAESFSIQKEEGVSKVADQKKTDQIAELYRQYRNSLLIIAVSYTHSLPDAEDLVQSAFTKAILSYEKGGSFLYSSVSHIR